MVPTLKEKMDFGYMFYEDNQPPYLSPVRLSWEEKVKSGNQSKDIQTEFLYFNIFI